ncbi:hypothetical protein BMS3Abin03_01262 [bacterium BMS3Abin03]|nr:hypothetical protein BMS3Abin03_01262 [bacterium BMS3Abin03]
MFSTVCKAVERLEKSTGKRNYDTESIEETEAEDQLI